MSENLNYNDLTNEFVLKLAELMSDYGASVHEIEDTLFTLNNSLGLNGDFVLFNRILFSSLGKTVTESQVKLKRFGATKVNLHRLEMVEKVFLRVSNEIITVADGITELEKIKNSKLLYHPIFELLSWPLLSAGFVLIMSGSWQDLICSCIISLMIYPINKILSQKDNGTGLRTSIPICAFLAAFMAVISNLLIPSISVAIIAISSLMKFMPGLYLTQAMTEIAYRRLISGMAHLCEAIFILLVLAFGVFLGTAIGQTVTPISLNISQSILPLWQLCIAGFLVGLSFIFSFEIVKRHIPIVICTSIIVTITWLLGKEIYGPVYGTGIAAIVGAFIANIYARISSSSDLILKLPSAIIIVPGIFAFRSLIDILNNNTMPGLEHFLTTFTLGAAIAGGFLIVDIIIPPDFLHGKNKAC